MPSTTRTARMIVRVGTAGGRLVEIIAAQSDRWPAPPAASALERAVPGQHGRQRLEEDAEVESDRPALEIEEVQADEVVEVELAAPRDLPQPGDARQDQVALLVPVLEALVVAH